MTKDWITRLKNKEFKGYFDTNGINEDTLAAALMDLGGAGQKEDFELILDNIDPNILESVLYKEINLSGYKTSVIAKAAKHDHSGFIEPIIKRGVSLKKLDPKILHDMAYKDEFGTFTKILIDGGMDPKSIVDGKNLLMTAIDNRKGISVLQNIVKYFAKEEISQALVEAAKSLEYSSNPEYYCNFCNILLENGADPNIKDDNGKPIIFSISELIRLKKLKLKNKDLDASSANKINAEIKLYENLFSKLLDKKVDINALGEYEESIIRVAIETENIEHIKFLIEKGINLNIKTENGNKFLYDARFCKDINVIKTLLEGGADPNIGLPPYRHHFLCSIISHYAEEPEKRYEIFELLIKHKLNLNIIINDIPNIVRNSILNDLAMFSKEYNVDNKLFKLLLENGANPNIYDALGRNTIENINPENLELIELFKKHGAKKGPGHNNIPEEHRYKLPPDTDLMQALKEHSGLIGDKNAPVYKIEESRKKIIGLLDSGSKIDEGRYMTAIGYVFTYVNDSELAKEFAKRITDPNVKASNDSDNYRSKHSILYTLLINQLDNKPEIIKILLEKGVDSKCPDFEWSRENNSNAILYMVKRFCNAKNTGSYKYIETEEHLAIIKALAAEGGCDINMKDSQGITALHYATQGRYSDDYNKKVNLIESLIKIGADTNITDNNGNTPLHYASEFIGAPQEIVKQVSAKHEKSGGASEDWLYDQAAILYSEKISEVLIRNGADRNIQNKDGKTASSIINKRIERNNSETYNYIREGIERLVERNLNILESHLRFHSDKEGGASNLNLSLKEAEVREALATKLTQEQIDAFTDAVKSMKISDIDGFENSSKEHKKNLFIGSLKTILMIVAAISVYMSILIIYQKKRQKLGKLSENNPKLLNSILQRFVDHPFVVLFVTLAIACPIFLYLKSLEKKYNEIVSTKTDNNRKKIKPKLTSKSMSLISNRNLNYMPKK